MKNLLRFEEAAMFIVTVYLLNLHEVPWWIYIILVLGPDIGMLGYLVNDKIGAICYNVFHHKGIAIAVYGLGIYIQNEAMQVTGLVLFGHSSMDRVFGYGLKYFTGFTSTHLGVIGKQRNM